MTNFSRKLLTAVSLVLATIVYIGVGAPSAFAETHPFLYSFGSLSNPNGIAVDSNTGDVYVADLGTDTLYKFDAEGNPVDFSALGTNALTGAATPAGSFSFPEAPGTPAAVAVDDSVSPADPSAGDLYVMDAGHDAIDKFSPSGTYLGQITEIEPRGLGIESNGDVRVAIPAITSESVAKGVFVDVFDNSVKNILTRLLRANPKSFENTGSEEFGFAVGPTGDGYALLSCGCVDKLGQEEEPLGQIDNGPADVAVAVDQATNHLYVDEQSSVGEWDAGEANGMRYISAAGNSEPRAVGTLVSNFGSLQLTGSSRQGGIAVNSSNGDIYVSNPSDGKIYVFGSIVPAVATAGTADVSQTGAMLQGLVDPRGASLVSCKFEYGPTTVSPSTTETPAGSPYGQSLPCVQTPAQIGSGTSSVSVSAEISSLQPGMLYHFRLDVASADGENFSTGLFATKGPGFGIKTFGVAFLNKDGTPDTQAGSHPYEMVTNFAFNTTVIPQEPDADSQYALQPDGTLKDVIVDLPPGLVGDPNATPKKCTPRELESIGDGDTNGGGHCPAESEVGELEVEFGDQPALTLSRTLKEPVYNMVPPHGVAAQFGANFIIPKLYINAGVGAGGDYPVEAATLSSPTVEPVLAVRLTMFGVVGEGEQRKAFLTLPTGCTGPLKSKINVSSYQEPGRTVEASSVTQNAAGQPVSATGCSKLQFPPTITVSPDAPDASTSSGLTVGVHVSQKAALNPEGLAESALRDTTVTLPEGVALNPAGADGLEACSEGLAGFSGFSEFNPEFEPGVKTATFTPELPQPLQPGSNFCPNGSKIGTVNIRTPLLEHELEGAVYLAAQNANPFGGLVAMYMIVEDPVSGSLIKLTGDVSLSSTGEIVTTFENTPDLPFEDLELHFFGGERAPLTTPSHCGTYTTNAAFTPWDGNGTVDASSSFQITSGPNGTPCPGAALPFQPSLTGGTTSNQAGGLTPFTMTMSREDGQQNLQAISLKMPPGLSGLLTGVELCGEAQADQGTCGPNSLIGETIVSVGVGSDPFTVTGGKVYLTGPYKGAPFGLSIVNPAKAGPYDLGQVIVRAKIEVDPVTADLTVTTDDEGPYKIPTIIDGIPLQIRHVNVTINRPGFTFNPTNCDPLSITGSLYSTEGAVSALSVPFQATNCAVLGFKPQFSVSTSGKTSRADGASLHVKLAYPKAAFGSQANIKSVKVDLPKQLPSNLRTLQKACPAATFEANPASCSSQSRIGTAKATTPLLPVPLEGPVYFVSHAGEKFPELIVVLSGYGVTVDLHSETFIGKTGITSSTFRTIPDVPVGMFELTLPEGPYSALAAPGGKLCTTKLTMPTAFTAQNGMAIHQSTPITVSGCPKHKTKKTKTKKKTKKANNHKKKK